jgi:hypothetical protein
VGRTTTGAITKSIPKDEIVDVRVVDEAEPADLPPTARFREYTVPEGTTLSLKLLTAINSGKEHLPPLEGLKILSSSLARRRASSMIAWAACTRSTASSRSRLSSRPAVRPSRPRASSRCRLASPKLTL